MTYSEAIKFLYDLQLFGAKLGLERTRKLAQLAGDPHKQLRFIHVAGTNGKGSTCAMLEGIYRAAGLRVGLFTSPHLVTFGERVQVNRQPISEREIIRLVGEMQALLAKFPSDEHATFFEVVTVIALRYFVEQKCDLVIWETGLGGRLDATNIVTPLASVITNIQFDHQAWLGDTLARIAAEKAGIIKPRVPVITAVDDPAAFRVIFKTAEEKDAPLWLISQGLINSPPLEGIKLPLLGEHQRLNAALATYTVRAIADKIPVSHAAIKEGLENLHWPGRLQLVERGAGKKYLLDGAHNLGGVEALRTVLLTDFADKKITLILGILRDKDAGKMCGLLAPVPKRILLTPVNSERTATPNELAPACRKANPNCEIVETASLSEALDAAANDPFVVIAGSLYLIGEAMELIKLLPGKQNSERNLNEWSATPAKH